jgi:hypothetical protein
LWCKTYGVLARSSIVKIVKMVGSGPGEAILKNHLRMRKALEAIH